MLIMKQSNIKSKNFTQKELEEEAQTITTGKPKSVSNLVAEEGCNTCPQEYPLEFRDILSFKEYKIAGMCQKCQDEVFGGDK